MRCRSVEALYELETFQGGWLAVGGVRLRRRARPLQIPGRGVRLLQGVRQRATAAGGGVHRVVRVGAEAASWATAIVTYVSLLCAPPAFCSVDQGRASCLILPMLGSARGRQSVRILIAGVLVLVMLFGVGCGGESSEKDTPVETPQETTQEKAVTVEETTAPRERTEVTTGFEFSVGKTPMDEEEDDDEESTESLLARQ